LAEKRPNAPKSERHQTMMFSRVVRVKPFMRQIIFQMSTTTQRSGTQQAAATAAAGKMDIDRPRAMLYNNSSDQFLLKMVLGLKV
jgi:hypothetical protein